MWTVKYDKKSRMDEGIRWEASKRLEFIDFRLYWEGRVNRGDLTDFFGISIPQASNDLSKYQELAPRNLDYDRSGKFYFATQEFKPVFYEPTSDDYLSQLKQISSGLITQNESIIKSVPDTYLIPVLERKLPNDTLKTIIHSLKNKTDLNVFYQSMSRQDPSWRWIAPKSLAYDGFRWHIRSYCFTRKDFRDFAIGRIWEIKAQRPTEAEEKEDNEWNTFITLKIGPNPNLSENQKNTIEMEYGMENGFKEVYVRQSLLSYFLRRYGLDHKCAQDEMAGQHIVLLNAESIPDNYKPIGF